MILHKFKDELTAATGDGAITRPPYVIRAKDLDDNFALCFPGQIDGNNAPYIIERTADNHWRLSGSRIFDVCENGQPVRYRVFAEKIP